MIMDYRQQGQGQFFPGFPGGGGGGVLITA